MTDHLIYTKEDGVATLTMNRPEVLNAFSMDMRQAMYEAIDEIEHDPTVRCVVLQGAGDHFMAGGDVKSFAEFYEMPGAERQAYFERRVHNIHPMLFAMRRMDKPIVASVKGGCAGAGMSFMMACDLTIAADDSFFKFSYVGIGASPDGSGSYHLPRIVGTRKALELAMLGDRFDVEKAEKYGLVNWVVPRADLEEETAKLAHRLANGPTVSIGSVKRLMYASHANSHEAQLSMEAEGFGRCAATEDWIEGVRAFNEKRKPVFQGK